MFQREDLKKKKSFAIFLVCFLICKITLLFHTELFCLNYSGENVSSCDVTLIFGGPFLEVSLTTREVPQSNV